ncbi:MAG: peroxiredoxin family protein [Planctomycetota bacterium]
MRTRLHTVLCAAVFLAAAAGAAPRSATAVDSLPDFTGRWVSGNDYHAADLRGKMVVVMFFDPTAADMRKLWTALEPLVPPYRMQDHVIFIGVCSGIPRGKLISFQNSLGTNWKLLADEEGAYAKTFGASIDKTTFAQMFFVAPDGSVSTLDSDPDNIKKSLKSAVNGSRDSVKWKIDPKEVPPAGTQMWLAFELGQWQAVCEDITTNLRSREPKLHALAAKMEAMIPDIIKEKVAAAQKIKDDGDDWRAYLAYLEICKEFNHRQEINNAYMTWTRIANETIVQKNVQAMSQLDYTEERVQDILKQAGGKEWYQAIIQHFPGTQAAQIAQALITEAEARAGVSDAPPPPAPVPAEMRAAAGAANGR